MASSIEICNIALSQIGANVIQSFDSPTKEARTCKLLYASLRDEVLSDHDWNFARKRINLALSTETSSEWDFCYQLPIDCLAVRKIVNPDGDEATMRIPFEVASNASGNRKLLLCNEENAELVYTARIEDANMYDALFVKALSYKIAQDLAQPLKGKLDLRSSMERAYLLTVSAAKAVAANQGQKDPDTSNVFTDSRA